jgi:hypothetical protein
LGRVGSGHRLLLGPVRVRVEARRLHDASEGVKAR